MEGGAAVRSRLDVFLSLITTPEYLALAAGSALAYFLVFYYLITASNFGIFLVTVPLSLAYIMVGSAGVLFSLGVYSVARALLSYTSGAEEGAASAVLPILGSLVATCGCSYSVLAGILAFLGINAFEVSGIISGVALYQSWLIVAIILVNLALIYYYSGRAAVAECRLAPSGRRRTAR